jgi:acyl-CoA thioesterase
MSAFEAATAVERLGQGRYRVDVGPEWGVRRGANGGVVAAVVLRALMAEVDDASRTPRSLTVHYPAALDPGPAEAVVTIERAGRGMTTASLRLMQEGKPVALGLGAFSPDRPSVDYDDLTRPARPGPDDLPLFARDAALAPPFAANYTARMAAGTPPFAGADTAEAAVWLQMNDPTPLDYPLLAALTDAWVPVIFSTQTTPLMSPTIDLTVHFRALLPLDGADLGPWLCIFRTRLAAHGFMEEDGEIWTRDGVLLAQSRQLALAVPVPG